MTSTAEVVKSFQSVTGADEATSRFYLESSGWDLGAATEMFFESGGQPVTAQPPGAAPAGAPQPSGTPASATNMSSTAASGQPTRTGGIRGFSDFSSDKEEGQNYYTGGKASGMMVQDPQGPPPDNADIVAQLMENARRHAGQMPQEEEPQKPPSKPVFTGSGYRLGDETKPSERIAPAQQPGAPETGPITRTLTFYRQGFTVDDGPLRSYTDPAESEFLSDINKGVAPLELERQAGGRPLSVNLVDKKSEDYVPPPKVLTPFSGTGQRLGGPSSAPAPPLQPVSSGPRKALDETQPVTSVQIRLHDGTRMVAKFNHNHTVGDLRAFIDAALPKAKRVPYHIQTTLPVRVLSDNNQTLSDAGIIGATVVQRPL